MIPEQASPDNTDGADAVPYLSYPVPGLPHGAIPGLLGVALNGARPGSFAERVDAVRPLTTKTAANATLTPQTGSGNFPAPPPVEPTAAVPPEGRMPVSLTPDNVGAPRAMPTSAPAAPPSADNSLIPRDSLLGKLFANLGNFRDQNRMTLLALAGGLAGSQNWGTGLSRAFQAAVPAQKLDIAQNQKNATMRALMARNPQLSPDEAMAIASNPTLMQQVAGQMFGAKQRKFTQIGEDMLGNKQFGFADEVSGKTYDLSGNEIARGSQGTSLPTGPDGQPLQGKDLLDYLDKTNPQVSNALRDMKEGKLNPNARNIQKLSTLASAAFPGEFDATEYPVRVVLRKSYQGGGKDFQEIQALNTVSGHMARLMDSINKLDPSDWNIVNKARNWWSDNISTNPKLVRVRNDLVTTQNELAKAYHGGHVTDASYSAFNKAANDAMNMDGWKAAIGEFGHLLESKIKAKEDGWRMGMQQAPLPEDFQAINREAKDAFGKIAQWSGTAPPAAPPASAQSAIPPDVQKLSPEQQMHLAPEGSIRRSGNHREIKRNGQWVPYQPVQQ